MKSNVDLTEKGHFSEGWMPGGWTAKGVFRKRKPMENSKRFKKILEMGMEEKEYRFSSVVRKLFGLHSPIILTGNRLTIDNNELYFAATTSTNPYGTWVTAADVTQVGTNYIAGVTQ